MATAVSRYRGRQTDRFARHGREYNSAMASGDQNGSESSGTTEFERFEALVKRLVKVPKAEVDALRKARTTRASSAARSRKPQ